MKKLIILGSSRKNGDNLGDDFWLPFIKSAEYLGMNYITDLHTYECRIENDKIAEFKQVIEEKIASQQRV